LTISLIGSYEQHDQSSLLFRLIFVVVNSFPLDSDLSFVAIPGKSAPVFRSLALLKFLAMQETCLHTETSVFQQETSIIQFLWRIVNSRGGDFLCDSQKNCPTGMLGLAGSVRLDAP